MRDKEKKGYTLEEQLRDDPKYKNMEPKRFEARRSREDATRCLSRYGLVDEYLETIGRAGEYTLAAHAGRGGEGRWQAFLDLAKYFSCKVRTDGGRARSRARRRDRSQHECCRQPTPRSDCERCRCSGSCTASCEHIPKMCKGGKEHLLDLERKVKHGLLDDEMVDERGKPLTEREVEARWKSKYKEEITRQLVKAREDSDDTKKRSAPVELLAEALDKLCHRNMVVASIDMEELDTAIQLAERIRDRAEELRKDIWARMKNRKEYQEMGLLPEESRGLAKRRDESGAAARPGTAGDESPSRPRLGEQHAGAQGVPADTRT